MGQLIYLRDEFKHKTTQSQRYQEQNINQALQAVINEIVRSVKREREQHSH